MVEVERRIERLKEAIRLMADKTRSRVEAAVEAWFNRDVDLAESIRYADDEIDEMELDLDAECREIIALHHPVASDLRYVLAGLRIVSEFERIADLARNIAKRVMKLERSGTGVDIPMAARPMADQVLAMVRDVCRALEKSDVELARRVQRADFEVDQNNKDVFRWVARQLAEEPDRAEQYLHLLVLVRALERIGDICGHVSEDIIFYVEGADVRHPRVQTNGH